MFRLKKINNGGDIKVDHIEVIVLHAEVVTRHSRHIITLRRVADGVVIGQGDTLSRERREVGWELGKN